MELQKLMKIIRSVCLGFVRNSENDLEDLMTESWLVAKDQEDIALIRTCARHKCIDMFRKQRRRRENEREFAKQHSEDFEQTHNSTPKLDLCDLMDKAIKAGIISSQDQELIWRYYYCAETYRRMSVDLHLAPSTLKTRMSEVEAKLRKVAETQGA